MPTDVIMPQMGESIVEGTITKWLKKVGEPVEKDEPLFEISTDKVDAEIPSPVAGVLTEIRFPEGATVEINTVVAVLGEKRTVAKAAPVSEKSREKSATPKSASAQTSQAKGHAEPPQETKAPPAAVRTTSGGIEIVMPQMGESIFEGTITKWLKKIGDPVQKDEPLFEISTDKVDAEIPSPVAGVLTEIRAAEGETVQINVVVAVIGGSGISRAGDRAFAATEAQPMIANAAIAERVTEVPSLQQDRRIKSSPLVRKIAKEHNVDLKLVPGTGSDGRINKEDILTFISQPAAQRQAFAPQAKAKIETLQPKTLTADVVPLTKMRAIIAQRMVESKRTSPHVHSVYKVDMTRVVRVREREKAGFEKRHGVKLTYMPFIAVAAVEALRRFPIVNASLNENAIHFHANINLGIAVALEWGLIVPTVREAEKRDFASIARSIGDLAARARTKKLLPDEVGGSTFTLTNPGIFGDEFGMPIINQPEAAILAIGALKKEPVVLTDAEGNDTIAIRSMQYYCLGFDHRLIDGADAGKFMSEFKRTLETWDRAIG
jgi:pyruvate dehydrogenase E2 component (dihydrolipoamide acetyltransferase)